MPGKAWIRSLPRISSGRVKSVGDTVFRGPKLAPLSVERAKPMFALVLVFRAALQATYTVLAGPKRGIDPVSNVVELVLSIRRDDHVGRGLPVMTSSLKVVEISTSD